MSLKAFFFKDEEDDELTPKDSNNKSATKASPSVVVNSVPIVPLSSDRTDYSVILEESLNEVDQPGADFLEFYKTLKSYQQLNVPDQQKYIMAFSGLSTMGLTREKIISTSPIYLEKLEGEKAGFEQSMKTFTQTQITDKQTQSKALEERNLEIQKEMQENITKIANLNTEVAQNQQKVVTKQQMFNAAIQNEETVINNIVNNVKTYLQ